MYNAKQILCYFVFKQVTGHRSVASLNEYRTISIPQQKEISAASTSFLTTSDHADSETEDSMDTEDAMELLPVETSFVTTDTTEIEPEISDSELNTIMDNIEVSNPAAFQPSFVQNCTFTGTVNFYFNKQAVTTFK